MFTTTGPLYDAGGSAIRAWLLDQGLLDAVVALPEGLSTSTGVRLYALVFSKRRRKVLFIDLRGFYQDGDARRLERRTISEAALDELSRSLRHSKPTAYSRTAAAKDLSFRQVSVTHHTTAVTSRREAGNVPAGDLHHRSLARLGPSACPTSAIASETDHRLCRRPVRKDRG
ncbi:hypothetical protein BM536_002025 [Streptomyces phaeoluteigriseus]|uniref:DNA methylase adenine-specific domain-containing protein n=2 Tax=Streptomyces phaeoluteigriseus TaxID=114686 RepID=A0A1V6MYN5_9ACTN|nr:hypothetical protein BM536_002025 [Streptomyces phaeoluteigriseus]